MNSGVVKNVNPLNLDNIFFSLNNIKTTNTNEINKVEAASLLKSASSLQKEAPIEEFKVNVSDTIFPVTTMYPEENNNIVKKEVEAYLKAKKEQTINTTFPKHIQSVLEQREASEKIKNEKIREFTIYESGAALGIVVGHSSKDDVFRIMKKYSKVVFPVNDSTNIHIYSDIFLYIFYDENNFVQELKFVTNYIGMTRKGLMLGDSIQEAIIIYGQPTMKSPKGAFWNKFAVFCDKDIIHSIRIHN